MKTSIRLIKQDARGVFRDIQNGRKRVSRAQILKLYETTTHEKVKVLNAAEEEITDRVLLDALVAKRHTDPDFMNHLLYYLEGLEA